MTLDLDRFIADCSDALAESTPTQAVSELVARAVSDSAAAEQSLGSPESLAASLNLKVLNLA